MTLRPALRLATDPALAEEIPGLRSSVRLKTAAAALDCDPSHVRQLLAAGQIEGHRLGKRGVRVYCDSIAAYQEGRPLDTTPAGKPKAPARPRLGAEYREALAVLRELGAL